MQFFTVRLPAIFSRNPSIDETSQAVRDLLENISVEYFGKLLLEKAKSMQTRQSQTPSKDNFPYLLRKAIVNHLKEDYSSFNSRQSQALYASNDDAKILGNYLLARCRPLKFHDFINMLYTLFIPDKKDDAIPKDV